jgi:hypothetical protein
MLEDLNRSHPCLTLRIVYLSEVENLSLDNPSTRYPVVLYYAPVAMFFTILFAIRGAEKHGTYKIPSAP